MKTEELQTIQIYLPDGNPTGIKVVQFSDGKITALFFPRKKLTEALSRQAIRENGIYFLFDDEDEEKSKRTAYIGEGDSIVRPEQHNKNKDFWRYAVVFSSLSKNPFTKDEVTYLQYLCIKYAKESGKYNIDNIHTPKEPIVSEGLKADLQRKYKDIKVLLAILGFSIFESQQKSSFKEKEKDFFQCNGKDVSAQGIWLDDGFVVFKGSTAVIIETKTIPPSSSILRKNLKNEKKLIEEKGVFVFVEDYTCKSPSAAANIVLGRMTNGKDEWKNKDGKSINEIYP